MQADLFVIDQCLLPRERWLQLVISAGHLFFSIM